jgi:hypothetical protein
MTVEQVESILNEVTGNPESGPIAEWIPAMARAVADAMNPATEKRVMKAAETR